MSFHDTEKEEHYQSVVTYRGSIENQSMLISRQDSIAVSYNELSANTRIVFNLKKKAARPNLKSMLIKSSTDTLSGQLNDRARVRWKKSISSSICFYGGTLK